MYNKPFEELLMNAMSGEAMKSFGSQFPEIYLLTGSIPEKQKYAPASDYVTIQQEVTGQIELMSFKIQNIIEKLLLLAEKIEKLERSTLTSISFETAKEKPTPVKVSTKKAKQLILSLFEKEGELDYIDLTTKLGLDLKIVISICEQLVKEGKIRGLE